ncbi:MAG TPA: ABC transporter substrate-binding protein [Acetobacteraceae bacterium]|nr:ABC transporter substrate-binding protein [Acetobacteraceae bacterium]
MNQQGSGLRLPRRAILVGASALSLAPRAPRAATPTRFVTANNNPYDTLDPHVVLDIGRIAVRLNLYDAPLRWVDNPPRLIPWLATKWTVSPDALSYTFSLRPGVKFHDGTPLTAEDVVFSIERILALKKGAYSLFGAVVAPGSTKALDAGTVRFTLKKPYAVFMAVLPELWIVNSRLIKQHEKSGDWAAEWLAGNEAGSGSYRLGRFDPAVGFQAKRVADHFMGWHDGAVDDAEFRVVMETASRVLGVEKGEFNTTDGYLPIDQIKRLRQSGRINIIEQPSIRTFYFIINHAKPPLDDVNLRRAICCAFDYDGFINHILAGSVTRNAGIIPNPMWGAPHDMKGYTYDLDQAKQHLAKVKAPVRPLQINAMAGYPQSEQGALLLQAGLRKLGLDVKIVTEPYTTIAPKLDDANRSADFVPLWRSAYYADPDNWTGFLFNSRNFAAGNASFYKNPRIDELTDKALVLTEQEQRRPLYEEVSRILVDQAVGLFVYNTEYYGPFTKNVKSIRYCPIGDSQDMRWVTMA